MTSFSKAIRPYVNDELHLAAAAAHSGDMSVAFAHLERAHVLGQASTMQHVRVHWRMLHWGARNRRPEECVGQLFRLFGALTKTAIGLIPSGNTGGSNISPFRSLPVPEDLAAVISRAKRAAEAAHRPAV